MSRRLWVGDGGGWAVDGLWAAECGSGILGVTASARRSGVSRKGAGMPKVRQCSVKEPSLLVPDPVVY